MEEVFKLSGLPTYTFVQPVEYGKLLVSLRTSGRGVIVEGPSGIGKTTAVLTALAELKATAERLTPRKKEDIPSIKGLPTSRDRGVVIIDDFHRLDQTTQNEIADFLKVLADEERADIKLVLVGINRVGDSLVNFAPDLNNRIDTLRFEANPDHQVEELVQKGEAALNIEIGIRADIVEASSGSFYLAQMLCHETCLASGITEAAIEKISTRTSFKTVVYRVNATLSRRFMPVATKFAAGPRLRREGRAPYLHLLMWLADSDEWSINLRRELAKHPDQRGSAGQIIDKGYLADFWPRTLISET